MSNPNPSPATRFKPGESGNSKGRPKGGLKDYDRQKFQNMTPEEKEEFLKKISPELRYRMAEGNPDQQNEFGGEMTLKTIIINKNGGSDDKSSTETN